MNIKALARKLLPRPLLNVYHWLMSYSAVLWYRFPASSLIVIGVTGTKGKTTTANMIWRILQANGQKCGLISTAQIALGDETKLNDFKMTMPGRFKLQGLFRRMVQAGCRYAVVETSSEGLAQFRHLGIPYRLAVFTNLSPEHIEAHGSYEKYRAAKARLFQALAKAGKSKFGRKIPATAIVNLDDPAADYFLQFKTERVLGYSLRGRTDPRVDWLVKARIDRFDWAGAKVFVNDQPVSLSVGGEFNVYNAVAAASAGLALGLSWTAVKPALEFYQGTPGRMEFIRQGQPFLAVVDYAHTADSLEQVYKTLKPYGRLLAVLGACGGGRDKAKRPHLGQLAARYAAQIWITNEDPYDEDPIKIMAEVAAGAIMAGKVEQRDLLIVADRRQAIRQAVTAAGPGDIVIITGKGSEQWLCLADNEKIPWDDRLIVKEELVKLGFKV